MNRIFNALFGVLILSSCAASYHNTSPQNISYEVIEKMEDSISFSYRYNVLREENNKRYARKSDELNIQIIAIKIINSSDSSIVFGKDYQLFSGEKQLPLLESDFVYKKLKQSSLPYLFFLLLTPLNFHYSSGSVGNSTTIPIGLGLGPGLMAINMGVSSSSNKKFRLELEENYLLNRQINKGDTVYGLIGVSLDGFNPISLKKTIPQDTE